MKYNKRFGIDFDDLLAPTNQCAIDRLNRETGSHYVLEDVKVWEGNPGVDDRNKFFADPEFMGNLPLYPGAKKFIRELTKRGEVFITSAVYPECMTVRAMQILREFPDLKPENIILGASKKIYQLDFAFDDAPHNILSSNAKFPVLMRRPWNRDISGVLAVNSYDDFIHLVELLADPTLREFDLSEGGVVCLVGPSGSGKTAIMQEMVKNEKYVKPITTTTRKKRDDEPENAYRFVAEDTFLKEKAEKKFLETTVYSGQHYGTTKEEIDVIIDSGKCAVLPIDICGGITIKNVYRNKSVLIFVDRTKRDVIAEIIGRNCTSDEKTRRILSLENEYKNELVCDVSLKNSKTIKDAAKRAIKICS